MKTQYYSTQDDIGYIPLTLPEELELIARWHNDNDITARDELIRRHLKLAAKLALQTGKGVLPEEDAISAGNIGLLQALESKKFDPKFGVRFSTYCRQYIKGRVFEALRFMCIAPRNKSDAENYSSEATLTGVLAPCYNANTHTHSLLTLEHRLPGSPVVSIDHSYEDQDMSERRAVVVEKLLKTLPFLEEMALRGEFFNQHSFADTAREHNVSREGVRKAYSRGMKKITEALAGTPLDALV